MKLHVPSLLIGAAVTALAAAWLWQQHSPPPAPAPIAAAPPELPAPRPVVAPAPAARPDLVLDLFEPDSASLSAQQSDSALRGQIEHALTVSFVLTKCRLITQDEYSGTYNDLITYAASRHMAPDLPGAAVRVREIAKSAGASYSLVYSRVPCTDASLPPLAASLRDWRNQLSSRTVIDNSNVP